jgi:hypothetical protein
VAGCSRRWSRPGPGVTCGRGATREPLGRLRWRTGSLRWRAHAQRSEEPLGRDAAVWAALLRRRVAEAHAHAALLQRWPSDSWSGSPTCGRCRMGSRRGALPVLFRLPSPKLDVRLSTHPATHGIVWRFATDFAVFGNAFYCFFQHDSFLLVLICVPRRDRHPAPSLSRHAARHVSRYIRSAEKDHRICTFGQSMRWSALSDNLCLFWRPVIACKS